MPLEIDIGAKIKARRLSNQQTLKQLAEKVGCTSAYLSQIENGKVSPSIASLKKISEALQAKITDFFMEVAPGEPVVFRPDQRVLISLERWTRKFGLWWLTPRTKGCSRFIPLFNRAGAHTGSTVMSEKNLALC